MMEPQKYQVGSGTIDKGRTFENHIAAYFSTVLLEKQITDGFIAINVANLGALDDLVLRLEFADGSKKTILFQLKHKDKAKPVTIDELLGDSKGDFSLLKYYSAFEDIQQNMEKHQDILGNDLEEISYVIFTNRPVNDKQITFVRNETDHFLKHFNTTQGKINSFVLDKFQETLNLINSLLDRCSNSEQLKSDMSSKLTKSNEKQFLRFIHNIVQHKADFSEGVDEIRLFLKKFGQPDFEKFLRKFVIMSSQSHANKIEDLLIQKLTKYFDENFPLKEIVSNYCTFIGKWALGALSSHFTITKTFATNKLVEFLSERYLNDEFGQVQTFSEDKISSFFSWESIIENKKFVLAKCDDNDYDYALNFFRKYVKWKLQTVYGVDSWSNLNEATLPNVLKSNEFLNGEIWRNNWTNKLTLLDIYKACWIFNHFPSVLVMNDAIYDIFIKSVIKIQSNLRFIILCKSNIADGQYNSTSLEGSNPSTVFQKLSDLDDSAKSVVFNCNVKFQGKNIKLEDVVGVNDFSKSMEVGDVIKVINNEFCLGNVYPKIELYIPQEVPKILLRLEVFDCNEFFVICTHNSKQIIRKFRKYDKRIITLEELNRNYQVFNERNIIIANYDCFGKLVEHNKRKTIHELHVDVASDTLEWVRSNNGTGNILKYRYTQDDKLLSDTADLTAFKNKISVICAGPGMGKSTFLDFLSSEIGPEKWVLRLNLNDYFEYYESEDFESNCNDAHAILHYFNSKVLKKAQIVNRLSGVCFDHYLKENRVIILLDGFDEISPWYKEKVTLVIETLSRTDCNIVLTTRPVTQNHVELSFGTMAFTLNVLNEQDQFRYLTRYFSREIVSNEKEDELRINDFVHNLLGALRHNVKDDCFSAFIGIPLQCKLTAEVFLHDCRLFLDDSSTHVDFDIDLLTLYERFIEIRLTILKSKYSKNFSLAIRKGQIIKYQQWHALRIVLPYETITKMGIVNDIENYNKYNDDTELLVQKDGIVTITGENYNLNFIHRTFAEYFVALWLSQNYQKVDVVNILRSLHDDPTYDVVRVMFDHIMNKKNKLSVAVLRLNFEAVQQVLEDDPDCVKDTDGLKRTALHLMVSWGTRHPHVIKEDFVKEQKLDNSDKMTRTKRITSLLIFSGIDVNAKEMVFGYTSYEFSLQTNTLTLLNEMAPLLSENREAIVKAFLDNEDVFLYYCCCFDYLKLMETCAGIKKLLTTTLVVNMVPTVLLQAACQYGSFDLVKAVIEANVCCKENLDQTNIVGCTPLIFACEAGHDSIVRLLVENGVDVNSTKSSYQKPLHSACEMGHESVVSYLIDAGAKVNTCTRKGTPLHLASEGGFVAIAALLIEKGANVNSVDDVKRTPLTLACWSKQEPMATFLIRNGADVNTIDRNKGRPLHFACRNGLETVVSSLVDNSAQIEIADEREESPLHLACEKRRENIVSFLIEKGANVNKKNVMGSTPLHLACEKGHESVAALLIDNGATLDEMNSNKDTPLHLACKNNCEEVVALLLKKGAKIDCVNCFGETPSELANKSKNQSIAAVLVDKGAKPPSFDFWKITSLHLACRNGEESIVDKLIREGANVNTSLYGKQPPLHFACSDGRETIVRLLVENGANLNSLNSNQSTPLHLACRNAHESIVNFLVKAGATVNNLDKSKVSPLHLASHVGSEHIVELLVENGANVNSAERRGRTSLYVACLKGHQSVVTFLVEKGAIVNCVDNIGESPLHLACKEGHEDIAIFLVRSGANIDCKSSQHETALYLACDNGHFSIVTFLLQIGAKVNSGDGRNSPLYSACSKGHKSITSLLIDRGANVNVANFGGYTPMHIACDYEHESILSLLVEKGANINSVNCVAQTPLDIAYRIGKESIIDFLVSKGGTVNLENCYQQTPLHAACRIGNESAVKALIDKRADVNAKNAKKETPLHLACSNGHESIAIFLIEKNTNINSADCARETPLYLACRNGLQKCVKLLVDKGAQINCTNITDETPLHIACDNRHEGIATFLIDKGANIHFADLNKQTPLHLACKHGVEALVTLLIEKGAHVNYLNYNKQTPLHLASGYGHFSIVALLVDEKSDINCFDADSKTALHLSCKNGHESIATFLVENGADVFSDYSNKATPLHLACENEHERIVAFLIKNGTNVDSFDGNKNTALHLACRKGHETIVKSLIASGAEVNSSNGIGDTPLHLATKNGHEAVVALLVHNGADVNKISCNKKTPLRLACDRNHVNIAILLKMAGANFL